MRAVSHKVKAYRREFRFFPSYMLTTSIFWLVATHSALTLGAIGLHFVSLYIYDSRTFLYLPFHAVVWEPFLVFGWLQFVLETNDQAVMRLQGLEKPPAFRVALSALDWEKKKKIDTLFGTPASHTKLAHELIEQWEWENDIHQKAGSPTLRKAIGFFAVPSAGNFATYLAGILAVAAGIVIALIDRELFFENVEQLWPNFETAYGYLILFVVLPITAMIIPGAIIVDGVRSVVDGVTEWINDDYLSRKRFYGFIKDLVEFEARSQRRLLMRTTGVAYWTMRIGTAPITRVPAIWKNMRRSIRIRRRRLNQS